MLLPWFGIRVRSCFERVTASILRSKGYEAFLPELRARRRWSDRIKEIQTPLFPGYVFCRLDPQRRLSVLKTPGVVSVVGFGGVPAAIPDSEIEAIRLMLGSALPVAPYPFLSAGQHVRIVRGPLTGLEGFVLGRRREFLLVISITLLQRSVSVEVEREWIEPIPAQTLPLEIQNVRPNSQKSYRQPPCFSSGV